MLNKDTKGITLIALVITIVIIIIITGVSLNIGGQLFSNVNLKTLDTNMLLIQAKVKVISEKNNFDENTPLKGSKVADITNDEDINKLKNEGVIDESDANYQSYYLWNQDILNEEGLDSIKLKDNEKYIVNYKTEEIIYFPGYKHTDDKTYYKLSDLTIIQEEME